ncbi:MAG: SPFH domain-containing protein [Firmicutes bacterium]|nr:SPFH domain-containing protein [Bacillota bacterium]
MPNLNLIILIVVAVIGVVIILSLLLSMWKKVPPDKAGVVTGTRKRVITGGGTVLFPVIERMDIISLENIPLDINTTAAMTIQGVPITATGVAVIKIKNEVSSILTAFEQFYTGKEDMTNSRIRGTVNSVLEGKLREIVGKMTVEEIYKDREAFSQQVRDVADSSLAAMGFELIAFTIKEITDPNGYLVALGAPRIAAVKKDAEIAKAEADKEAKVKISQANREGEEARLAAEAAIAQAEKDKQVKQSTYQTEAQTAKARADAAYEIEQNKVRKSIIDTNADAEILNQQRAQQIATESMQVEVAKQQKNIELAQTKADAKKRELAETVINPAEAARQAVELQAEAEKIRNIKQAEAAAEAEKKKADAEAFKLGTVGKQEAEVIRMKGEAEATAIRLKLEAEADGMRKKAEAYKEYGNAAVVQMLVEVLPEMAKNVAEPISNIDKVIVWDSGTGGGGAMKMAETVTKTLAATIDAVNEMTGFDLRGVLDGFTKAARTDRNINVTGVSAEAAGGLKIAENDKAES